MTKSNKLIKLIFACLLLLSGCVDGKNNRYHQKDETITASCKHTGNEVLAPAEPGCLVENPVDIKEINDSRGIRTERFYFKISGLKDKSVENKINDKIKALYDRLCHYADGEGRPPFRGIMQLKKYDSPYSSSVIVSPGFNYNNILSVRGSCSYYTDSEKNDALNFNYIDSLNFNLNTGETFCIADVFANNVNDFSIVNNQINEYLNKERLKSVRNTVKDPSGDSGGPFLVAPFKGITDNQRFYISDNDIHIIINENNPEFDFGFRCPVISVPFEDFNHISALTKRFFDKDNNIYKKQPYRKRFLQDAIPDDEKEETETTIDNISWHKCIYINKVMQEKYKDIAVKTCEDEENNISELARKYKCSNICFSFEANHIGSFLQIFSIYELNCRETIRSFNSYLFDKDGSKIELGDVFIKGFDYEKLIKDCIQKELINSPFYQIPGIDGIYNNTTLNQMTDIDEHYNNLVFALNDTSIKFETKTYKKINSSDIPLSFTIYYEDIGYDNLAIFKD